MRSLPTLQRWRVVGITYELGPDRAWLPVVRHEFYGPTREAALHVRESHLRADAFLRACEQGHFGGVTCQTVWYAPDEVMR